MPTNTKNPQTFSNLEKDKYNLRIARQELQWKEDEVYTLEKAVEFGRCMRCRVALDSHGDDVCEDCATDLVGPEKL